MNYFRKQGSDTWHFMETCSNFPKIGDDIQTYTGKNSKPHYGEFCNECLAKSAASCGLTAQINSSQQ